MSGRWAVNQEGLNVGGPVLKSHSSRFKTGNLDHDGESRWVTNALGAHHLAKTPPLKTEERAARLYADRLILEKLTELQEVFKPSEIADELKDSGLGLAAVRSLLASNPEKFAYHERRWVPASRVEGQGRPFAELCRLIVERFGGPMPLDLLAVEASFMSGREYASTMNAIARLCGSDPELFQTRNGLVGIADFVFRAYDESVEDAFAVNDISAADVEEIEAKLGDFNWRSPDAITLALEKLAPVSAKLLMAAAWKQLNSQDPYKVLLFNWKSFAAELLAVPDFILGAEGEIYPESAAKKWISAAVRLAEKLAPSVEMEDATPLELKPDDISNMVSSILSKEGTTTAISLLEDLFEITPSVKTFPDDLASVMAALKKKSEVVWVGGDRFQKAGEAPDYIGEVPAPFEFVKSDAVNEDGDPLDVELVDEGLSTSLRKLIAHPLATDVLDEDEPLASKHLPETVRLVLKPIHRELGTFPLSQFPYGWFGNTPNIQELIWIDEKGNELQIWLNHEARLLFGMLDWWLEQPVESGAVFSLTATTRPNVFEFAWLEGTDPVVYISNQRMEGLREIASRADEMTTLDILCEVMTHWPKGTDFLTLLWEVNVVRRTSRRLLASLLSSYVCFYQRSGSPVWHYDAKKLEQGFDKSKRKFIKKD